MASLLKDLNKLSAYRDRRFPGSQEEYEHALVTSTTMYIGNMSFYTTEEQVYELFTRAGEIKKIIMGLDKNTKTPCGFCFALYYSREDTEDAVKYISGTILDDRLFVLILIGDSKKEDSGAVVEVVVRFVMNIVQTMMLISFWTFIWACLNNHFLYHLLCSIL